MRYVILFLLSLSSQYTQATDTISLYNQDFIYLDCSTRVFIDFSDTASLHYASTAAQYLQQTPKSLSPQKNSATYWIKFHLVRNSKEALILSNQVPRSTRVRLFKQIKSDSFVEASYSNYLPLLGQKYSPSNKLIDLNLAYQEEATFYAKIKGAKPTNNHIQIGSKEVIYQYLITQEIILNLFIGIMLLIFCANFVIFVTSRDINYLLYSASIGTISLSVLSMLDGSLQYSWSNLLFLSSKYTLLIGSIALFFSLQFMLNFLDSSLKYPRFCRFVHCLSFLVFSPVVIALVEPSFNAYRSFELFNLLVGLSLLIGGFQSWYSGYKPARFFTLGWLILLSFVSLYSGTYFGFIGTKVVPLHYLAFGIILKSLFISFALADKANFDKSKGLKAIHDKKVLLRKQNELLRQQLNDKSQEIYQNHLSIKQHIKEKETLLKEVHHRVKNNLQVITSLLSLQKTNLDNEKLKEIFTVSQNRINSMAIIHEMLYQSNEFTEINFKDYLPKLAAEIIKTHRKQAQNIRLNITVEEINFNLDLSIALGLIINEIMSNSIQHGFRNQTDGMIHVTLSEQPQHIFVLKISDNGSGINHDLEHLNNSSIGLNIIKKLAKQIQANIILDSYNKGVKYTLTFPKVPSLNAPTSTSYLANNRSLKQQKPEYT